MKCIICGKEFDYKTYDINVCSTQCFDANYWLDRVKNKDSKTQVVYEGVVYQIDREDQSEKGYYGQKFEIEFLDGSKVLTTNLWHNGTIPEAFKELLPNNAKTLRRVYE